MRKTFEKRTVGGQILRARKRKAPVGLMPAGVCASADVRKIYFCPSSVRFSASTVNQRLSPSPLRRRLAGGRCLCGFLGAGAAFALAFNCLSHAFDAAPVRQGECPFYVRLPRPTAARLRCLTCKSQIIHPPPRKRGAIRFQSVFGKRAAPNKTRASVRKKRTKEKTD